MEIKTIEDLLKVHTDFVQKVQKHVESIRKGKAISVEELIQEKEELLTQFNERLDAVTKAREQAIRRYDEEIKRHKETISRLEKDIQENRKLLGRAAEAPKQAKEKGKGKASSGGTAKE